MTLLVKHTITSSLLADVKAEETVFKQFAPRKMDIQLQGTSSFITVTTELKVHPKTGQEGPEGSGGIALLFL